MATATLTFRRLFNGERMGDLRRRVSLTAAAIRSEISKHCGDGWGCTVELTPEQLTAAGGWLIHDGSCGALAHGDQSVVVVRPPHRPRLDPAATRVVRSYRLNPRTIAAIDAEAKRTGESAGQVVDRLALGLGVIQVPDGKAYPRCRCGGESRPADRVPAFLCQKCGALFAPAVSSVQRDADKITTRRTDGSFETVYDDGMRIKGSDPDEM
jgi:hypothetical protein